MNKNAGWQLEHSFLQLPKLFFSHTPPDEVPLPSLLLLNQTLATELGFGWEALTSKQIASWLSGNILPENAEPIAQAYAGHQFGHFTMLGDGRAILLGEQITPYQKRYDIQLKGAGQTPFSRRGDGKATISAMLREYVMSEAMHYLGIPTSRSLAVVGTGEPVYRETTHKGAVLTRVAASHIRVGTFEYARNFLPKEMLSELLIYTVKRHYPELENSDNQPLAFLEAVMNRQIDLIIHWLRVGFVHGVMNTDNMSIAGETLDYGPCAFMNAYHLETVFSSIDTQKRYAFGNQPTIALWNLACLAGALLPLLDETPEVATQKARILLDSFKSIFESRRHLMMCRKLGIDKPRSEDALLTQQLLDFMQNRGADYTNTFLWLRTQQFPSSAYNSPEFAAWLEKWKMRVLENDGGLLKATAIMAAHNPAFIPRNHLVEEALENASQHQNFGLLHELLEVWRTPYQNKQGLSHYQLPPETEAGYKTFCGT